MDKLKRFVFDGLLLSDTFQQLRESGVAVEVGTDDQVIARIEERSFSPRITHNANQMAAVFIAFFCIENAARELISERMLDRQGAGWWEKVPIKIRNAVERLKEKEEQNRYHTSRSVDLIGYTLFGNLAQIIIANWEDFSDLFPNQAWVTSRFHDLEMSRNIIMHTGLLPQIEIERVESIARDWIRQVG
ncbi:MAG: Swt1 family HEPN domain-containing protein [Pyrinomonadaceae bacterium]